MIRLLALDLDGTLLNPDNRISETDAAAVQAARDSGVRIVLATSRWYGLANRTAQLLELDTPIICHNGAHIREAGNGSELLHLRIPIDAAREISALSDEERFETYTTVDGITYVRAPWQAHIPGERLPDDMHLAGTHAEFVTAPATGIIIFGDEAVRAVTDAFAERYAGILVFPAGWSETFRPYVTITAAGADKGRALRAIFEHLNIAPEETVAMGDAAPDLPMFEAAGFAVAMGNAPEDVQALADAIAPPNTADGVAWAIQRFVLGKG